MLSAESGMYRSEKQLCLLENCTTSMSGGNIARRLRTLVDLGAGARVLGLYRYTVPVDNEHVL